MEIGQINIKMNQKATGMIAPKDMKQNGESMKSFSEILALFDNLVLSGTVIQAADPSLESEAKNETSVETDLHVLTDEDMIQLDSILMSLISAIQEGPYSGTGLQNKVESKSSLEASQLQLNQSPNSHSLLQGIQSSESKSLLQDVHSSRSSLSLQEVEAPKNSMQFQGQEQTLEGSSFIIGEQASRSSLKTKSGEYLEESQSLGLQPLKNSISDQAENMSDVQVRQSVEGSSVLQGVQEIPVSSLTPQTGQVDGDGAILQVRQPNEGHSVSQGIQQSPESRPLHQTGQVNGDGVVLQVRQQPNEGHSVSQGIQQSSESRPLHQTGQVDEDGAILQAPQPSEGNSVSQGVQQSSESIVAILQTGQVAGNETLLQARQPLEGSTDPENIQITDINLLNHNQLTPDNDDQSLVSRSLFDESQTLDRHSQLEGIITKLGQLIELQASHSEEPGQWSQKSIEILQTSDENLNVLMQKLARTIVQSDAEGTGVFDLESLKIIDIIESIPLPTDRTGENRMYQGQGLYNQNSQAGALETETWLGMGKYKTISTSSESNQELQSLDGNRVDQQIPLNGGNPILSHRSELVDTKNVIPPMNLPVSEFVPEVSEWMGRNMRFNLNELGKAEAKFSLFPQHFGHIEIKITSNDGQISAQIITNSSVAQEALEGQLNLLRQALQQQGLVVQKLDIIQQTPSNIDVNQSSQAFSQNQSESSPEQREFSQTQQGLTREQDESEQQNNTTKKELVSITYGGPSRSTTSQIDFTA